jgi:hypothetical protein
MQRTFRFRLLACTLAASAAAWLAACASPPSPWLIEQAEEKLAAGKPALALQYSERAIHIGWERPSERAIALHLQALRELGRSAEADAFHAFVRRYDAGEDTNARDTRPSWRECFIPRSENQSLRGWTWRGLYDIGTTAATFEIHEDGSVQGIRVLRARHPAAAWLMIAAVGDAGLPGARLEDHRADPDTTFPLTLCVWLNPNSM